MKLKQIKALLAFVAAVATLVKTAEDLRDAFKEEK